MKAVITNVNAEHCNEPPQLRLLDMDYLLVDDMIRIQPQSDGSVSVTVRALSNQRLTVQPRSGNQVILRLEPT